ncbi:MAG: hypothetical protein MI724_17830 [Spirochaetales bacterium]|nr:hypothetical protein [Spirochaetales bacterium]
MFHMMRRLTISIVTVSLMGLFVVPRYLDAQDAARDTSDAAELIAATAGRLLPTIDLAFDSVGPVTVAVDEVVYDGRPPRMAPLLTAVIEDELLAAARRFQGTLTVEVRDSAPADVLVNVDGGGDGAEGLFVVQLVQSDGRILASSRLRIERSPELADALRPAAAYAAVAAASADEVPNDPDAAVSIAVGEVVADLFLETEGDEDWFSFVADETSGEGDAIPAVNAFTTGTTDTYIEVYGPDTWTALVGQNDDASGSTNASISFAVEPGSRYWIKVRGFANSATGPYSLHLANATFVADSSEPNNTLPQATRVGPGDLPLESSIRPSWDSDWYAVDLAAFRGALDHGDDPRDVPALRLETESQIDTVMVVYDEGGREIAYNDDGGDWGNARVLLSQTTGLVYVEVRGFGDSTEGDYRLVWGVEYLAFDEYEPDNVFDEAARIVVGASPQRRTFSSDGDVDWLRIDISPESYPEGRAVTIETYGDTDTYMTLYDQDVEPIISNDDGGFGFNARIDAVLEPGVYYVDVAPLYLMEPGTEYSVEVRSAD